MGPKLGFIAILGHQTAILGPGTWIGMTYIEILSLGLEIAIKSNFWPNFIGFKVSFHEFYWFYAYKL